jgi:hypothetical protein
VKGEVVRQSIIIFILVDSCKGLYKEILERLYVVYRYSLFGSH